MTMMTTASQASMSDAQDHYLHSCVLYGLDEIRNGRQTTQLKRQIYMQCVDAQLPQLKQLVLLTMRSGSVMK